MSDREAAGSRLGEGRLFQAEREAALQSGREDALRRGLLFDTGPCPF